MMWSIDTAIEIINKINPVCRKFGYFVCLYGSVLYEGGSDKDIDLQIISTRGIDCSQQLIDEICNEIRGALQGDVYHGLLNTKSYVIKLNDGRIIDTVIRTDKICRDGMYV